MRSSISICECASGKSFPIDAKNRTKPKSWWWWLTQTPPCNLVAPIFMNPNAKEGWELGRISGLMYPWQ